MNRTLAIAAFFCGIALLTFWGAHVHCRRQIGCGDADRDWNDGTAVVRSDHPNNHLQIGSIHVLAGVDEVTGLPFSPKWTLSISDKAYNQRIAELIAAKGMPEWSLINRRVETEVLINKMMDGEFTAIEAFPWYLADAVRVDPIVPTSNGMATVSIHNSVGNMVSTFVVPRNALIEYQLTCNRRTVVVRCNGRFAAAYTDDGRFIKYCAIFRVRACPVSKGCPTER